MLPTLAIWRAIVLQIRFRRLATLRLSNERAVKSYACGYEEVLFNKSSVFQFESVFCGAFCLRFVLIERAFL